MVLRCGRTIGLEVAARELSMGCDLGQGMLSVLLANPVAEENIGRLGATVRPQADNTFKRGSLQKIGSGLAFNAHALNGQLLDEFSAGQRSLMRKHVTDDAKALGTGVLVQSQLLRADLGFLDLAMDL